MASQFYLKIYTTDRIFYDGYATDIVVPQPEGQIGIMAHHENMVMAIEPGDCHFTTVEGELIHAYVGSGMCSVMNNRVVMIVDTAEQPDEIDALRAQEALDRAKERLRQKQSIQEYYRTQASIARALSRLKEKSKYSGEN
jgi:F-type H+-transporting ATPase subunit epsilon